MHYFVDFNLEEGVKVLFYVFLNCLLIVGLADENESVRDAALGAGHVLVEHYATT